MPALLRCVMRGPAAALAAMAGRRDQAGALLGAEKGRSSDRTYSSRRKIVPTTKPPTLPLDATEDPLPDADRRNLRQLARLAARRLGTCNDTKLERAQSLVQGGFHSILWCWYIATAEYVARRLLWRLRPGVQVACVTGRMGD